MFLTSLPMMGGRRYTPTEDARVETYLGLLNENGLTGALLVQPSFLGTDNGFLLDVLARARHEWKSLTLKGVAVLDPSTSVETLWKLKEAGIVGARLNCFGRPVPDLESGLWSGFLARVEEMGWHVELHLEGARLAPVLDRLCAINSKVVVDHFGLPDAALPPELLTPPHDGVHVKCSAPYRVFPDLPVRLAAERCGEFTRQLLDSIGPRRLIWGSDWPWTQHIKGQSYADTLNWWEVWTEGADILPCEFPSLWTER
ncbi:MAG: amidohydrolase family protein [Rhodospirillales bacterium]|nr:amidohydrolase family protein [Rhodospirillales bacterium]